MLTACSNKQETEIDHKIETKAKKSTATTSSQPKKNKIYSCEECVALVNKIVRSSDYDDFFKTTYKTDYSILVNEATKEKVLIQIVINDSVPMGWLELQIKDGVVNDITNDPKEPKDVHANTELISDFKQNCLHCCLD